MKRLKSTLSGLLATAILASACSTMPLSTLTGVPATKTDAVAAVPFATHCTSGWDAVEDSQIDKVRQNIRQRVDNIQARLISDDKALGLLMGPVLNAIKLRLTADAAADQPITISAISNQQINQEVQRTLFMVGTANTGTAQAAAADQQTSGDLYLFEDALGYYFTRLFEGKYVDRFGATVGAPALSPTVSDAEIQNTLSVFLDAVIDFVVRAPVWVDNTAKPTIWYPAAFASPGSAAAPPTAGKTTTPSSQAATKPAPQPTADAFATDPTMLKNHPQLATDQQPWASRLTLDGLAGAATAACQMDVTKLEAVYTLAQLAKVKAAGVTGITLGSIGGIGFSLGAFGKVSVGDNQMLQAVVQTIFGKAAQRIAFEGGTRVAYRIDDRIDPANPRNRTLANIFAAIAAASQPEPGGTSTK